MVLEYKAGPPAKLAYLRSTTVAAGPSENSDSISGKRYEVVEKGMDWTKAKAEAEKRGGHLAVITNAEKNETIANMISTGKKSGYWLGGVREKGVWKWVNNESMDYTNWELGANRHPDSWDKMIIFKSGQWNRFGNYIKDYGYIIEWG
jgi:hypothetical protein